MRIRALRLRNFKRFSDLYIRDLPQEAKLVILVGPNGCGKSSVFDAFRMWYGMHGPGWKSDELYYRKSREKEFDFGSSVAPEFHTDTDSGPEIDPRKRFHFRSAYRNDADFTVSSFARQPLPDASPRFQTFIQDDRCVSSNYQRLVSRTLQRVYGEHKPGLTVDDLQTELIGQLQESMGRVFEELVLEGIGNPVENGSFFFQKGAVRQFHYKNLSGGEKSAFDLLLDMILMREYYPDAVYCIDEPEAHLHTALQRKLVLEMVKLVPPRGQLWITTHSLGMLVSAREVARNNPNEVVFLDFANRDFDEPCEMAPASLDGVLWEKFLTVALDDYASSLPPEMVVMCEGSAKGRRYRDFDARCYEAIFAKSRPGVTFVSGGACTDIEDDVNVSLAILKAVLPNTQVLRVVDRDDKSETEIADCRRRHIRVLARRHLESYLLDDEVLAALCEKSGKAESLGDVLSAKETALANAIAQGKPQDDIKSAAGEIYVATKRLLSLTQVGNTTDAFLRDTVAPLVTPGTTVYEELEACLFPE